MKNIIFWLIFYFFFILLVVIVFAQNEYNQTIETNLNITNIGSSSQTNEPNTSVSNLTYEEISNLLSIKIIDIEVKEEYNTNLDYPISRFIGEKNQDKEFELTNTNIYLEIDSIIKHTLEEELMEKREYKKVDKPVVALDIEQVESKIFARGNILFGISYGTVKKIPEVNYTPSSFIRENFNVNQDMQIYSTSKIGNKVNVDIEFDQKSAINKFNVSYKEPENKFTNTQTTSSITKTTQTNKITNEPFVRELTFGEVSFSKAFSKYINYTAISTSAQGIKFVGKRGNFSIEAIGTLSTSVATKKEFIGTKRANETTIKDIDYIKRKFFKLPDKNIDLNSLSLYISTSISGNIDLYIDGIPFRKMVQGSDYIFDLPSSEIELKNSIDRSTYLAVFYTFSNGQSMTISSNIYKGTGSDLKDYLYLFKPDIGYSPYEMKNIYPLGSYDIDLSKSIEMQIYYTSDPNLIAPIQFSINDYYIDPRKGIIRFNNPTPFLTNLLINFYELSTRDPNQSDSTYTMKLKFFDTVVSYQLDFDVVEGSEEVRINGILIPKNKYTIYYPIGRIYFNDPTLISEGDKVEISYEYKPLFGGSQKISLGAISDYRFSDFFSTKLSSAFWTSQGTGTAPRITTSSPMMGLISSLSGDLDFKKLFSINDNNLSWTGNFEYSVSLVNPNSFGAAIIEDFENNKRAYIITKDEDSWYLASAPTNLGCYQTNRGILYYKDYRQYYANESFVLMSYSWNLPTNQILPYSQKPGPYIVSGGRLNQSDFPNVPQTSLVFDYDFSDGGNWVGALLPLSSSGLDFSDIEEIIISYKLQMDNNKNNNYDDNNTNTLNLFLELGKVSEDLDGDGIMEYETSTVQDGFDFHLSGNIITKIGGGRKGTGNSKIDSEDLNKNGRLDTEENTICFSNTISGSGWQKLSIKIPYLTSSQLDILKKVYQLRLTLKKVNGVKGRLLIDEMQIKFRTSSIYKIDGVRTTNPYQISSTTISVYDSALYLKNRFFNVEAQTDDDKERLQEYSYLHGTSAMSLSEAKSIDEASLRIIYNLSNTSINTNFLPYSGGKEGVNVINYGNSQNYSIYSKLIMYIFIPTTNELGQSIKSIGDSYNDENAVIRFVSKEMNYFEFIIPMSRLKKDYWNRLELRIDENKIIINNNINDILYANIIGLPSWRDINYLELGARVNDNSLEPTNYGEIWFNEFFLTDVKTKLSSAINSSISFNYNGNLFKINNFSLISSPYSYFFIENIFPDFKGNGGKDNVNIFNFSHFYSSDLLQYTAVNYSFSINSENSTYDPTLPDYLFYTNQIRNFRYSISSKHNIEYLPSISYSFSDRQSSYIQNGIVGTLTNLFLQINKIQEIGLDSNLNINYQIPYITRWINIGNNLSLSSSYSGKNYNSTTNNIFYFVYPSYQSWVYSLNLYSYIRNNFLNINNYFKHSETFSSNSNYPYEYVNYLSEINILQRNLYALKLLSEGFKERGERKEVYETDTLNVTLPSILKFINIYLTPSYEFKDFNFKQSSNTMLRDLQMNGKVTYKFEFNINNFGISSISLNSSLSTTFSGNSIPYELKWYDLYTNEIYRGIVAIPFYEHLGLWGYQNLNNSLIFVSNLSHHRSILSEFSSAGLTLNLLESENLFSQIIPRSYSFDYSTTTTRELSSFRQLNKLTFASVWYIPIYKLNWFIFRRDKTFSANDISINFSYSKEENFNTLTLKNQYSVSSLFSGLIMPKESYSLSYTMLYSYQDNLRDIPSFYSNFGIGLVRPPSLQSTVSHSFNFSYNSSIVSNTQIDLIFTKIDVNSVIENKEELNFYTESIWYNNNNFLPFKRKVFEINLYHETSANFSEFAKVGGYIKFLLTQMSEIYVENGVVNEKFFEIIPGFEVGINLRITF